MKGINTEVNGARITKVIYHDARVSSQCLLGVIFLFDCGLVWKFVNGVFLLFFFYPKVMAIVIADIDIVVVDLLVANQSTMDIVRLIATGKEKN